MLAVFMVIFRFCSSSRKSNTRAEPATDGESKPAPASSESVKVVLPWSM